MPHPSIHHASLIIPRDRHANPQTPRDDDVIITTGQLSYNSYWSSEILAVLHQSVGRPLSIVDIAIVRASCRVARVVAARARLLRMRMRMRMMRMMRMRMRMRMRVVVVVVVVVVLCL